MSLCACAGFRVKEDQPAKLTGHSKQHEVCLGLSHSHMVLPIPLQLSPSFATNVCSLQYQLHFEFVTRYVGTRAVDPD